MREEEDFDIFLIFAIIVLLWAAPMILLYHELGDEDVSEMLQRESDGFIALMGLPWIVLISAAAGWTLPQLLFSYQIMLLMALLIELLWPDVVVPPKKKSVVQPIEESTLELVWKR